MLNDVCQNAVIDFGCVSSKFMFSRVKVCVVVGYGSSRGNGEKRESFWNDLDSIVDRV